MIRRTGRRRLVALITGSVLLLAAVPGHAAPWYGRVDGEAAAMSLLDEAVEASATLSWTGTQYVASWRERGAASALVEMSHTPSGGAVVRLAPTPGEPGVDAALASASAGLDARMLPLLDQQYELRVADDDRCTGRAAHVVEAHRDAASGGGVAGRFWLDAETGLVLRRDVLDEQGRRMSSSAFVDLSVDPTVEDASSTRRAAGSPDTGERLDDDGLDALRRDGWPVPPTLPGGFGLFDARVRTHDGEHSRQVVHMAYSDGLSITSLFAQRGALGARPPDGFGPREMAGTQVWSRGGTPERVVWGGGGRVWTLVSDAPASSVVQAVAALPREDPPQGGLLGRLTRGAQRLAAMLNPFS